MRAKAHLERQNVLFHSGLNEDLAATAIWGTQQAELRGEGKYDGVFGMWYGKGPASIAPATCSAMPTLPARRRTAACSP